MDFFMPKINGSKATEIIRKIPKGDRIKIIMPTNNISKN